MRIFLVTVENLLYFVCRQLCSLEHPQEEPLYINSLLVWRINNSIFEGTPGPFHYIKCYKGVSNVLKNAPLL